MKVSGELLFLASKGDKMLQNAFGAQFIAFDFYLYAGESRILSWILYNLGQFLITEYRLLYRKSEV